MATLAPIPRASDSTATEVNSGDLRSVRREYWRSRSTVGMIFILRNREKVTRVCLIRVYRCSSVAMPVLALVAVGSRPSRQIPLRNHAGVVLVPEGTHRRGGQQIGRAHV